MTSASSNDLQMSLPFNDESFNGKITGFYDLMSEITLQDVEASPEERRQLMADTLRFDDFCTKLTDLFGKNTIEIKDMKVLFRKISANPDAALDWCELFGYQDMSLTAEDDFTPFSKSDVNIFAINFRNRAGNVSMERRRLDTTRSLRYCKHLDTYLATSKKGIVTQWNMKLDNVYVAEMPISSWLIDCVYSPNFKKLICCTERELIVWDPKVKTKAMEFFIISSFENAFTSMTSLPTTDLFNETLLLGDDEGYITTVTISPLDLSSKHASKVKKSPDGSRTTIIISYKKLSVPVRRRKVHSGWVVKLEWIEELYSFMSCCSSSTRSLVIDEIGNLHDNDMKLKSASVYRGVNAFAYSIKSNIVATAGTDKIVRIWHPTILTKPTGRLIGHLFTVVAIQFNERDQHIISLSSARVIRVWCINSMTCLQIFTDNDDRAGEKRIQTMLYDQTYQRLITGSGVIDAWSLTRSVINKMVLPQTHQRSIVQVVHNAPMNQYISVCTDPVIKVWDSSSCNLIYQLLSPHAPNIEVTFMAVSHCGYRLATGASNGSIKIWDLGAGQEVKHYEEKLLFPTDENESQVGAVVSLQFLTTNQDKQRFLIAAGWSNELRLYNDADGVSELELLKKFNDTHIRFTPMSRTSTIVSSLNTHTKLPPIGMTLTNSRKGRSEKVLESKQVTCTGLWTRSDGTSTLLAGTASGSIILWDSSTANVTHVYKLAAVSDSSHADILDSQANKTVNMVGALCQHQLEQKTTPLRTPQVATRLTKPVKHPTLIIAVHEDAGIRFWNTDGQLVHETVAMTMNTGVACTCYATSSNNELLVTGDLLGYLTVWQLSELLHGTGETLEQVVSWRAHNSKVTSIIVKPHKVMQVLIFSAGADGSIRIWFDKTCRYLGYMGQSIPIHMPTSEDLETSETALPCDIKEKPLFSSNRTRKKKRKIKEVDVPLVVSCGKPTTRNSTEETTPSVTSSSFGSTRFFKSLSKPKQYNYHLEHVAAVADLRQSLATGVVFQTLPVYRVSTPKSIAYPKSSFRSVENMTHSRMKAASTAVKVPKEQ